MVSSEGGVVAAPVCSENVQPNKKAVLVLGMVFATHMQAEKLEKNSPAWRDYNRLCALESTLVDYEVHTVTHNNHDLITRPTTHNVNIGRRGAGSLHRMLERGVRFDLVLCDYFRFPCEYMREAYQGLLTFLYELNKYSRLCPDFKVFLPNLQNLQVFTRDELEQCFASIYHCDLRETSTMNPLYKGTQVLQKKKDGINSYLSGYCNETELKQLDSEFPFLRLTGWTNQVCVKRIGGRPLSAELGLADRPFSAQLEKRRRAIRGETVRRKGVTVISQKNSRKRRRSMPPPKHRGFARFIYEKSILVAKEANQYLGAHETSHKRYKRILKQLRYAVDYTTFHDELQELFESRPELFTRLSLLLGLESDVGINAHEKACTYIEVVKKTFDAIPAVYDTFWMYLRKFKLGDDTTQKTLENITLLFQGHDDLLLGFCRFLPIDIKRKVQKLSCETLRTELSYVKKRSKKKKKKRPSSKRSRKALVYTEIFSRIRSNMKDPAKWKEFLKWLELLTIYVLSVDEFAVSVQGLFDSTTTPLLQELLPMLYAAEGSKKKDKENDTMMIIKQMLNAMVATVAGEPLTSPTEKPWTHAEDLALGFLSTQFGNDYTSMATYVSGRSVEEITSRLQYLEENNLRHVIKAPDENQDTSMASVDTPSDKAESEEQVAPPMEVETKEADQSSDNVESQDGVTSVPVSMESETSQTPVDLPKVPLSERTLKSLGHFFCQMFGGAPSSSGACGNQKRIVAPSCKEIKGIHSHDLRQVSSNKWLLTDEVLDGVVKLELAGKLGDCLRMYGINYSELLQLIEENNKADSHEDLDSHDHQDIAVSDDIAVL